MTQSCASPWITPATGRAGLSTGRAAKADFSPAAGGVSGAQSCLATGAVEKLGSHQRPVGIRRRLPVRQLPALLALAAVEGIWVEEVEGLARLAPAAEEKCWSIKARFAVQIEQKVTGLQLVEERILLVTAPDEEAARKKLLPTFVHYAEPYLNPEGWLVRWQFEVFLDAYEVEAGPLAELLSPEGLEVFSETKSRRLKPELAWLPAPFG